MKPYTLHHGDVLAVLPTLADNSVDAIVCDPPYELGFMGKSWDASGIANSVAMWTEALRVLKPGGHLLAFSGSRTYHRMTCAIEDAGFEIRDQIMWLYGTGFPKSLNVSKAIDKDASAERVVVSDGKAVKRMIPGADQNAIGSWIKDNGREFVPQVTLATTAEAQQWDGWGTALKPAHEPICVARKPLVGTVAANVLQFGTGAINIDACRVDGEPVPVFDTKGGRKFEQTHTQLERRTQQVGTSDIGRWPANIIHDGSDEVVALFPVTTSGSRAEGVRSSFGDGRTFPSGSIGDGGPAIEASTGSAARFFYCAKASKSDRNEGLDGFAVGQGAMRNAKGRPMNPLCDTTGKRVQDCDCKPTCQWVMPENTSQNTHPTVKPTDLMAYLCRLVTPPGGVVLDPFMGSGSTGKAAMREGFRFIGIDMTEEYIGIATARIEHEHAKVEAAKAPKPEPVMTAPTPQLDLFGKLELAL